MGKVWFFVIHYPRVMAYGYGLGYPEQPVPEPDIGSRLEHPSIWVWMIYRCFSRWPQQTFNLDRPTIITRQSATLVQSEQHVFLTIDPEIRIHIECVSIQPDHFISLLIGIASLKILHIRAANIVNNKHAQCIGWCTLNKNEGWNPFFYCWKLPSHMSEYYFFLLSISTLCLCPFY